MNAPANARAQEQREAGWAWPIDVARYDRTAELSAAEREHLGRLALGSREVIAGGLVHHSDRGIQGRFKR